jgi:hypothetical protein
MGSATPRFEREIFDHIVDRIGGSAQLYLLPFPF